MHDPSGNNYGYGTNRYSNTTREAEAREDMLSARNACQARGTHRYETMDGAYRMKCYTCGDWYFRDKAIF